MTMIVNVSGGTRNLFGVELPPGGMADVNASAAKLNNHLFVRCGDVQVSGASVPKAEKPKGKPGPKPKAEKAEGDDNQESSEGDKPSEGDEG